MLSTVVFVVDFTLERTMADAIARERVRVLMELAGRCLLQYQRIERALKILLPHMTKPGVEAQEDAPNWREFLDGRHTLGPLMERFKEVLKSDSLMSAHAHLERIVIERNDLVHHFFTSSGRVLASSEAIESGISELQRRLDHSDSLDEALASMVGEFARELQLSRAIPGPKEGDGAL